MFEKERSQAAQRSVERRQREDEAPRLSKEVPGLVRLRAQVCESGGLGTKKYVRHIIVPTAPALFLFGCGDEWCRDGGHDLSSMVLYALRAQRASFDAQHTCDGTIGSSSCRRIIDVTFSAHYG